MKVSRVLCALAALTIAGEAASQMRGFQDTLRSGKSDTEREPREHPGWDRDRESSGGTSTSPAESPAPAASPWTAPVEARDSPPMREPEFAAARCETYRRQMWEAYEAEAKGENRQRERQVIQQARLKAGC